MNPDLKLQDNDPQLTPKEYEYLVHVCGEELAKNIFELVMVNSQEALMELPQKLRDISYDNAFVLSTMQTVKLCIFAKAYLLRLHGSTVLMKITINEKVEAQINSAQFNANDIRRNVNVAEAGRVLPHLENLGLIDDTRDLNDLENRLLNLKVLVAISPNRMPTKVPNRRTFNPGPEESFADEYYLLSMAMTRYYGDLLDYINAELDEFEDFDNKSFFLGLQNYLMLKLANQPYREIFHHLNRMLADLRPIDDQNAALQYLSEVYYPQDSTMYRGVAYCLGYNQMLRQKVTRNIELGLPGYDQEVVRFVDLMWSTLASIKNNMPHRILSEHSTLPDVSETMLLLFEKLGRIQSVKLQSLNISQLVIDAGKLFESLISSLDQNGVLGKVLPPTQLIALEYIFSTWEKAKQLIAGMDAEIEVEDEPDLEVALEQNRQIEIITDRAKRVRNIQHNIAPVDLHKEKYPLGSVLQIQDGDLIVQETQLGDFVDLYQSKIDEMVKYIESQGTGSKKLRRYKASVRINGDVFELKRTTTANVGGAKGVEFEPNGLSYTFRMFARSQIKWLNRIKDLPEQGFSELGFDNEYLARFTVGHFSNIDTYEPRIETNQLRHDVAVVLVPDRYSVDTESYHNPVLMIEMVPYMVVLPTTLLVAKYLSNPSGWSRRPFGFLGEEISNSEIFRTSVGVLPSQVPGFIYNYTAARIMPMLYDYGFKSDANPRLIRRGKGIES